MNGKQNPAPSHYHPPVTRKTERSSDLMRYSLDLHLQLHACVEYFF